MLGRNKLVLLTLLLFGFVLRIMLFDKSMSGDISVVAEWGERMVAADPKDFYFNSTWYYSQPAYPPISNFIFGASYYLSTQNIFAQLHNFTKVFPSSWVTYLGQPAPFDPMMYTNGYYLLLKLPTIIADILLSLGIYLIVKNYTKNNKKALLAMLILLFNPISIFLSGVWGQTESIIALFGFVAFYLLSLKKISLSMPLLLISLYIKPTWAILIPLYLAFLIYIKPKIKELVIGSVLCILIFVLSTWIFADGNLVEFTQKMYLERISPFAKGTAKASISAFNFYAALFKIDITFTSWGIGPLNLENLGTLIYIFINWIAIKYVYKGSDDILKKIIISTFAVSLGSFLFLTNMLERYFYPALPSLIVLVAIFPRQGLKLLAINLILFFNLIWAFYRRSSNEVDHFFTNLNYFTTRIMSFGLILLFISLLSNFNILTTEMIKFINGRIPRAFRPHV